MKLSWLQLTCERTAGVQPERDLVYRCRKARQSDSSSDGLRIIPDSKLNLDSLLANMDEINGVKIRTIPHSQSATWKELICRKPGQCPRRRLSPIWRRTSIS